MFGKRFLFVLCLVLPGCSKGVPANTPAKDGAEAPRAANVAKGAVSPAEEARFLAAAKKAFADRDAAALASLTCWDRVPDKLRQSGKQHYERDVAQSATDITLTEPDPAFPDLDWTENGVTYHSNLPVIKQLKIIFAKGSRFGTGVYPVGEKDGKLVLLEPAPK
jgi:hypothetical protein